MSLLKFDDIRTTYGLGGAAAAGGVLSLRLGGCFLGTGHDEWKLGVHVQRAATKEE